MMDTYPARNGAAVTPHDTNTLAQGRCRSLYVGGAGNVAVQFKAGDSAVTFPSVPAGSVLPVSVERVMSTNTTATNIVALY